MQVPFFEYLSGREHLELLEDKLREYRTVTTEPKEYDDKVNKNFGNAAKIVLFFDLSSQQILLPYRQAVALSQLDSLRKELLRAARDRIGFVLYSKVGYASAKLPICPRASRPATTIVPT